MEKKLCKPTDSDNEIIQYAISDCKLGCLHLTCFLLITISGLGLFCYMLYSNWPLSIIGILLPIPLVFCISCLLIMFLIHNLFTTIMSIKCLNNNEIGIAKGRIYFPPLEEISTQCKTVETYGWFMDKYNKKHEIRKVTIPRLYYKDLLKTVEYDDVIVICTDMECFVYSKFKFDPNSFGYLESSVEEDMYCYPTQR